ncbi:glycosyltransferase family 2 protein [Luteimonas sp. A277]
MAGLLARLKRSLRIALQKHSLTTGELLYSRPSAAPLDAPRTAVRDDPLISVIMTCHNTSAFVERAADSILSQSWQQLELVIVDDASTDGTRELMESIQHRDARVKCIFLDLNKGTYEAKNFGITQASGDVITFMDSDDWCDARRLELQLGALRGSGVVSSSCNYIRIDGDGNPLMNRGLRERRALISLMVKRKVLEEIGMFDSVRTSADDELFERIRLVYGRDVHVDVPQALYFALARPGSLSASSSNAVLLEVQGHQSPLSAARQAYVEGYRRWHRRCMGADRIPYAPFPAPEHRPFPIRTD